MACLCAAIRQHHERSIETDNDRELQSAAFKAFELELCLVKDSVNFNRPADSVDMHAEKLWTINTCEDSGHNRKFNEEGFRHGLLFPFTVRFHKAQTRAFYLHKHGTRGDEVMSLGMMLSLGMMKAGDDEEWGGTAARVWPPRFEAFAMRRLLGQEQQGSCREA